MVPVVQYLLMYCWIRKFNHISSVAQNTPPHSGHFVSLHITIVWSGGPESPKWERKLAPMNRFVPSFHIPFSAAPFHIPFQSVVKVVLWAVFELVYCGSWVIKDAALELASQGRAQFFAVHFLPQKVDSFFWCGW